MKVLLLCREQPCHMTEQKQQFVARSSALAEFRAMAHGICEGIWLTWLMDDLKILKGGPIKPY